MKALRITWRLSSHMVLPERGIHLDNLIGHAAVRSAEECGDENPLETLADLPFEKAVGADGQWVWKASQLALNRIGSVQWHSFVRRHERTRWGEDRDRGICIGKADAPPEGTGDKKAYLLYQPLVQVQSVQAWCVGEPDMVEGLLGTIRTIGRSDRMGWGTVRDMVVEEAPEREKEFWRYRSLPDSLADLRMPGHRKAHTTVRPPYWNRAERLVGYEIPASTPVMTACA